MGRILMLAHRLPYPPNKGDKIRAFHVLTHLAKRHEVTLGCLVDDPDDLPHVAALRELGLVREIATARIDGPVRRLLSMRALWPPRSITVTHFHRDTLQRTVDGWIGAKPFDGVMCSSAAMAEYVFRSRHLGTRLGNAVKVMDLIDVDSCKWAQYAAEAAPPLSWLYRHEARWLARYEQRIVTAFDRVFLVSASEARMLGADHAGNRVGAFSNGVDLDYFSPSPAVADVPTLVFTGVMDYRPNVEAVDWFARRILPRVRAAMPGVRFAIVGSRPNRQVQDLASLDGVTVTGFVDDVRGWLARAAVCVAPLRIARGIQNKVLEAMAMARPVVATPEAFEGIDALPGRELLVAADEASFADAVLSLLRDPRRAAEIGTAARACMERGYRWDSNLAVLDEVFA